MTEKKRGRFNRRPKNKKETPSERKKKEGKMSKKCAHCGSEMKPRGASDAAGGLSWKCRNKTCGRTVWIRKNPVPPTPLVPTSISNVVMGYRR